MQISYLTICFKCIPKYNYYTKKFHNYIVDSLVDFKNVFNVLIDSKNNFWVSGNRFIYVYNQDTKEEIIFKHDNEKENSLSSNIVHFIIEDSESDIWIGTDNGLNLLTDFNKGIFKHYVKGFDISHITESDSNIFWLATDKGLCRLNKKTNKIRIYNADSGLPVINIYSVLEDELHNLWVSSEKGISKLNFIQGSLTETVTYRKEDGINIGNFFPRVCTKLSDGTMAFGGHKGFCMFRPWAIKKDTLPPAVVFTDLKVSDKTIKPNEEINGQVVLYKSFINTKSLTLNYNNNAFVIGFAGIHYNLPQYIKYAYRLDGYDKTEDWHYTDSKKREVEYMNLPAGQYTFKVKAANCYGVWNNTPSEISITVLSPWWLTIWFVSLIIVLIIILVGVIVRIRTRNLQKQKQKLETIVEERTSELKEMNVVLKEGKEEIEQQMLQMKELNANLEAKSAQIEHMAQQLHEADQSKLRFFANISHEFKTPLSLIIAPLEKISKLKQPVFLNKINLSSYHELMLKNAKRLLRLINQLIDFRKIEQGGRKLNLTKGNIVAFIKEVIVVFSALAEQKNIKLTLETQYPVIGFAFDTDIIEKILYNLISNAIKYTNINGEVSVQVSVNSNLLSVTDDEQSKIKNQKSKITNQQCNNTTIKQLNNQQIIIRVSDSGIGVMPENLDKIFDRFFRANSDKDAVMEGGTGIGLAYTKELVELHKGSIMVESTHGRGTSFTVVFTLNKELYDKVKNENTEKPLKLNYIRTMLDTETALDKKCDISNTEGAELIRQGNKKPGILLVEDNIDLRKFIKNELLESFEVFEAGNGSEGVDLAAKHEPELIISDIMMPVMDGLELCKKIKMDKSTSHIPVILLTAKSGEDDMYKGLKNGADDYLAKPFSISILKIKIENLFIQRKRLQEKFSQSLYFKPSEITCSDIDEQFITKAIQVVKENMKDAEFSNDKFVDYMNYGRTIVYTKVKKLTGQSLSEFIRSIRLKAAAQFLLEGNDNIADIAYRVGFSHPNNLTKYFTKKFGKPPREFLKDNRKK